MVSLLIYNKEKARLADILNSIESVESLRKETRLYEKHRDKSHRHAFNTYHRYLYSLRVIKRYHRDEQNFNDASTSFDAPSQDPPATDNTTSKEVSSNDVGFDDDISSNGNENDRRRDEGDTEDKESGKERQEGDKEDCDNGNSQGDTTMSDGNPTYYILYLTCINCKRQ